MTLAPTGKLCGISISRTFAFDENTVLNSNEANTQIKKTTNFNIRAAWNQAKSCMRLRSRGLATSMLGCHRGSHTWESNISLINMLTIRQFNTAGFNISEYLSLWGEKWEKGNRERRKWQWHYLNRSIRWAFSCSVRLGYVIWKPQVLSDVWHSTYSTPGWVISHSLCH